MRLLVPTLGCGTFVLALIQAPFAHIHGNPDQLAVARANIAVKIFGDDLIALRSLGKPFESAVHSVPGVVDLSTEQQTNVPTGRVQFNRTAGARYGLPAGAAADALQTAYVR